MKLTKKELNVTTMAIDYYMNITTHSDNDGIAGLDAKDPDYKPLESAFMKLMVELHKTVK